jgi:hypothetical protein
VDEDVTASDISISDSLPDPAEAFIEDRIAPDGTPMAYGRPVLRIEVGDNGNNPDEAVANGKYFEFTVTADCGYYIDLDNLAFSAARGGDAPPRGWVVRADVDCFSSNIATQEVTTTRPTLTPYTIDLSSDCRFQGLTELTFRVYSYTPGAGRSVEYVDVTLNGTVHQ